MALGIKFALVAVLFGTSKGFIALFNARSGHKKVYQCAKEQHELLDEPSSMEWLVKKRSGLLCIFIIHQYFRQYL